MSINLYFQEERELSEIEITLHRTRSLLGEKVIHLKHLEQSLERVADPKKADETVVVKNEDMTLSDMSSASSGFSSTDLGTETFIGQLSNNKYSIFSLLFSKLKKCK